MLKLCFLSENQSRTPQHGSMTIWHHNWRRTRHISIPVRTRRWLLVSAWERNLAKPVQTYISTSRDPYLNLSIEHDFLLRSARDSVVLFLYVNRPSVVIGRNQNPWLEVNLPLLNPARGRPETEPPGLGAVDLVRRRSGGGTVFHDEGNVNWTVICPKDCFTRDKHAEMVVLALRSCGVERARVNKRHDIVLDQGDRIEDPKSQDTHVTPYTKLEEDEPRPLKVSGSAYKITGKHRALHHGTCLLSSPNLNIIPDYLHSPVRPFIKEARGVQSVSSPVGNILLSNDRFRDAVYHEFLRMYPAGGETRLEEVGKEMLEIKTISDGLEELMVMFVAVFCSNILIIPQSLRYKYEQTPRFILSNASDEQARVHLDLTIREGRVIGGSISASDSDDGTISDFDFGEEPYRPKLHEIDSGRVDHRGDEVSWENVLAPALCNLGSEDQRYLLHWLRRIIPPDEEKTSS